MILDKIDEYRQKDSYYAGILYAALLAIGEEKLSVMLGEAERLGKRLDLTYPIPLEAGPSEPCGVKLATS